MSIEIGSEFWNIPLAKNTNHIFDDYDVAWYVSGRAAFRSILRHIQSEDLPQKKIKVALPSYLCESLILPLQSEGIEYDFYEIQYKGGCLVPDFANVDSCNVILLIDYFGYKHGSYEYDGKDKIIIRDLTHSIFSKKYNDADYYFGSLRKWAGFYTGGFAYKQNGYLPTPDNNDTKYTELRKAAMKLKDNYIQGKIAEKEHLNVFHEAEELLDNCYIAKADDRDIHDAYYFDADEVKKIRRENATVLINGLKQYSLFKELGKDDYPLFVPILVNDRDGLRKYLINEQVYCPIHWPKPFEDDTLSKELYEHELSLICDQRYSKRDMNRIVDAIIKYMEKEKNA